MDDKLNLKRIPLSLIEVESFIIDVSGMNPDDACGHVKSTLKKRELQDKIVTLRVFGRLKSGKVSDIDFRGIVESLDCYACIRNISNLTTKEFEEVSHSEGTADNAEQAIIREHSRNPDMAGEEQLTNGLIEVLSEEKHEGEKNADFEKRIIENMSKLLKYENS